MVRYRDSLDSIWLARALRVVSTWSLNEWIAKLCTNEDILVQGIVHGAQCMQHSFVVVVVVVRTCYTC